MNLAFELAVCRRAIKCILAMTLYCIMPITTWHRYLRNDQEDRIDLGLCPMSVDLPFTRVDRRSQTLLIRSDAASDDRTIRPSKSLRLAAQRRVGFRSGHCSWLLVRCARAGGQQTVIPGRNDRRCSHKMSARHWYAALRDSRSRTIRRRLML